MWGITTAKIILQSRLEAGAGLGESQTHAHKYTHIHVSDAFSDLRGSWVAEPTPHVIFHHFQRIERDQKKKKRANNQKIQKERNPKTKGSRGPLSFIFFLPEKEERRGKERANRGEKVRWECQSRGLRAGGGGGGAGGRTMPPPRKGGGRRGRRGGRSERRRPAGNGPAGPAGSGAGRRAAAATTEERRRQQSFGVGGQRRGGGLRSVPARDSQTPPGTVGISFLTLFLSGNSSPGRSKAAVPFACSQMAELRSRDQAVSEIPPWPR